MAVKRSHEKVLTRAQAIVPVAATGAFTPTTDNTEGGAIGVFLVDVDGVPYSAGAGTITVEAEATAAAPSYVEGTANPLSMDLGGALRVTGSISATTTATATVAAPTYVEGDPEPLSQDLDGNLRTTIVDGADVTQGSLTDTAWNGSDASHSVVSLLVPIAAEALSADPAQIEGATAADAALTAKPVTTGGLAKTANPTAVADGDVVNTLHDKLGKVIAVSAVRDLKGVQHTTITASTSETTIVTAVASTFNDLYGLIIANSSATATEVTIKDATAGTTRATIAVPANASAGFMLDAGSAIPQAVVNNNWTATAADSVTSLFITALYVKNT